MPVEVPLGAVPTKGANAQSSMEPHTAAGMARREGSTSWNAIHRLCGGRGTRGWRLLLLGACCCWGSFVVMNCCRRLQPCFMTTNATLLRSDLRMSPTKPAVGNCMSENPPPPRLHEIPPALGHTNLPWASVVPPCPMAHPCLRFSLRQGFDPQVCRSGDVEELGTVHVQKCLCWPS